MIRCPWCEKDSLYIQYHDKEWGVPVHEDRKHFEFLVLESAQAGLSWLTILRKRAGYRKLYDGFDPVRVAGYGEEKIEELMGNGAIVRNKRKIIASINNAARFLEVQRQWESFDRYLWHFVDNRPVVNAWKSIEEIPARTALSDEIGKDLKQRGFTFLGSTIVYSHLQAVGIVNDHIVECFRYEEVKG